MTKPIEPTSRTVTVACKEPNGLVLQLSKSVKWLEETPSGTRERVRYDTFGVRHRIMGPAYPSGQAPAGFRDRPEVVGGYALTEVPAEFWEQWIKLHAEASYIVNKTVFAERDRASAKAKAREHESIRSGFEPLKPGDDPRIPKPVMTGVGPVQTAERA